MSFRTLPKLDRKPDEIIVVMDGDEEKLEEHTLAGVPVKILHTKARGAAAKRNLGVAHSSGEAILFVDDDVEFRVNTVDAMEKCLENEGQVGGVSSFIENQQFQEPGLFSRLIYSLCGGWKIKDYAGKCFGPLINLYPRPYSWGPEFQQCEWLNATCTMYRKAVLPSPCFDRGFTGYSFMEDLALSRRVRKKMQIGMSKNASYIHHSRPALYKANLVKLQKMALENRHHILCAVEGWSGLRAAIAITWLELLLLPAKLREVAKNPKNLGVISGSLSGLAKIWGRSL